MLLFRIGMCLGAWPGGELYTRQAQAIDDSDVCRSVMEASSWRLADTRVAQQRFRLARQSKLQY